MLSKKHGGLVRNSMLGLNITIGHSGMLRSRNVELTHPFMPIAHVNFGKLIHGRTFTGVPKRATSVVNG